MFPLVALQNRYKQVCVMLIFAKRCMSGWSVYIQNSGFALKSWKTASEHWGLAQDVGLSVEAVSTLFHLPSAHSGPTPLVIGEISTAGQRWPASGAGWPQAEYAMMRQKG